MPRKPTTTALAPAVDLEPFRLAVGDLERESQETQAGLAELSALSVTTEAERDFALALCQSVKVQRDALECKRKAVTGPLAQVKRTLDGWFKPITNALDQAEAILKGKILAYNRACDLASQKALEAAAATQDPVAAQAALTLAAAPRERPAGLSERKRLCWEVTDPAAVPLAYLSPDPAKIQAAVQAGVDVPGVRTWLETSLAVRTG